MNNNKYVIFGAGKWGNRAIKSMGKENVFFCVDNDVKKNRKTIEGVDVYYFGDVRESLINYKILITVAKKNATDIIRQLMNIGVNQDNIYIYEKEEKKILRDIMKEKLKKRVKYLDVYSKAIQWIHVHTLNGQCIIDNTKNRKGYPEVTGYYIPTLLKWGYRDLAISYGTWLCEIQRDDGSWYDSNNQDPYVFDSAQVIKGLLAIKKAMIESNLPFKLDEKELDVHIIKGIDWILSCMDDNGQLITPSQRAWGDKGECLEIIHLYCLQPIFEAERIYKCADYGEKARKILSYYKNNRYKDIVNFNILSHFYAYVIEALVDLGEKDIALDVMGNLAKLMDEKGFVPAYKNSQWCCSTGLFQLALIWYKLGDVINGNKAFNFACKLQNKSGGWFGSYINPECNEEINDYFPIDEISWANKFFLDALYYKNIAEFNNMSSEFISQYSVDDGRYAMVRDSIKKNVSRNGLVLDVGCGKGAYLSNLLKEFSNIKFYGVDISKKVMEFIQDKEVKLAEGSLTSIPYPDNMFDFVYTTEALEHAVDVKNAIRELCRVTKPGGSILVIDKNITHLGDLEITEWEQWFDVDALKKEMEKYCVNVIVDENVSYYDKADGLFCGWLGQLK